MNTEFNLLCRQVRSKTVLVGVSHNLHDLKNISKRFLPFRKRIFCQDSQAAQRKSSQFKKSHHKLRSIRNGFSSYLFSQVLFFGVFLVTSLKGADFTQKYIYCYFCLVAFQCPAWKRLSALKLCIPLNCAGNCPIELSQSDLQNSLASRKAHMGFGTRKRTDFETTKAKPVAEITSVGQILNETLIESHEKKLRLSIKLTWRFYMVLRTPMMP